MGGGISSLSKICVVKPAPAPAAASGRNDEDAQVEFTFVQVGVREGVVDYEGNCGNMTAAIGPFAVDTGIVDLGSVSGSGSASDEAGQQQQQLLTVKLFNTNTNKVIHATFPVCDGEAVASGPFVIDGVAGTGAKIRLDFIDPAGSKTGSLLPTGNKVDIINGVRTTCIDVGNPCIFVPAGEVLSGDDANGTILPDELQNRPDLLTKLESIRQQAAVKMGMAEESLNNVPPSIPKICLVSRPTPHRLISGEMMDEGAVDVVVRAISTGQPHKALPITAGLALSAAARMEGTVVSECLRPGVRDSADEIVIGHPSGKLVVAAGYDKKGNLERATVYRTARRLMEGKVYWK